MKEFQAIVRHLTGPGRDACALATLVSVEGSSYRRPGARLLVTAEGTRIGSISGGCLEEDVLVRARAVLASGQAETVVYDTTSENDLVWGVGLGCHGIVQVLVEKISARPAWAVALAENFAARRPTPLAVVHGPPSDLSAKVYPPSAAPEATGASATAGALAKAGAPDPTSLGTRLASELSAPVAGAKIFFQTVAPPRSLIIFGAGDDAQPLARLAHELGWHVTVADPRAAFATAERFPTAEALRVGPANELAARVAPGPDALAVVMTHHYVHDVPLLRALLPRSLAYLGLLGPKKRSEKILGDLASDGFVVTPAMRARLHAPVGLDLGADSPAQVALAIVAEMQAALASRDARPLRERTRPIHE